MFSPTSLRTKKKRQGQYYLLPAGISPSGFLVYPQSTEWPISSPPPATLIHPSPPLCAIHEIEIVTDAIRELIPFPHTTTYRRPKKMKAGRRLCYARIQEEKVGTAWNKEVGRALVGCKAPLPSLLPCRGHGYDEPPGKRKIIASYFPGRRIVR